MSDCLHLSKSGNIARLTIDNPPANAWTADGLRALAETVDGLGGDIRALIISGRGDKFFSAGADIKIFANADRDGAREMVDCFHDSLRALADFRGVAIAAINGYAFGGGLETALACDIRIAADNAKMALPEAGVGLLPGGGGTQLLPALVGDGWAKRIILCGETVDAKRALQIGLVEEVTTADELQNAATRLAESVCKQSPDSVDKCKQLIKMRQASEQALAREREMFVELWDGDNRKEGCAAFLQKRKPQWR